MYIYIYISIHVDLYIGIYIHIHTCIHICVRVNAHLEPVGGSACGFWGSVGPLGEVFGAFWCR